MMIYEMAQIQLCDQSRVLQDEIRIPGSTACATRMCMPGTLAQDAEPRVGCRGLKTIIYDISGKSRNLVILWFCKFVNLRGP